jgi:hypothetical protein
MLSVVNAECHIAANEAWGSIDMLAISIQNVNKLSVVRPSVVAPFSLQL